MTGCTARLTTSGVESGRTEDNRSNEKMINKDVTIERLGFVRELLHIGGFNSKIKANCVKTIDDAITLLKEQEEEIKEKNQRIWQLLCEKEQ